MTAVILQARLDSLRLPRKAMLSLDGEPMIFRVMEVLNAVPCDMHILACPHDAGAEFKSVAKRAGFFMFTGSKNDVLSRYAAAVKFFEINKHQNARIIRATGDNPFVFADAAYQINKEAAALGVDYAGYSGLPYGAGVESVSCSALLDAESRALSSYDREHVCPYIYRTGSEFSLHRPQAPAHLYFPQLRLTVDTADDYEKAAVLYTALSRNADIQSRYHGKVIIKTAVSIFERNDVRPLDSIDTCHIY
jgi:spore coat polysaccharide biosynthesis protein SpsF